MNEASQQIIKNMKNWIKNAEIGLVPLEDVIEVGALIDQCYCQLYRSGKISQEIFFEYIERGLDEQC